MNNKCSKLGDLCDLQIGRTPPRKEPEWFNVDNDFYKWVSIKDMNNKKWIDTTSENISFKGQQKFNIPIVKKDTVILSFKLTLGRAAICSEDMLTNEAIAQLPIKNPMELDRDYLYYYLKNYDYTTLGNTSSIATAVNSSILKNMYIKYPDINIQKKIAKVLNSIDNKIELNQKICDNILKLMTKKFDEDIEGLNNPQSTSLSEIANYKNGLAMQNYRPTSEIESLPVVKIKEMNTGITNETERCKFDIPEDVIINNGDILFAWSGTLCIKIWCDGKAGLNQHIFKVTSDKYPKWFYYLWTSKHLNNFIDIAKGKATTMGHIKRSELDKAKVLIPINEEMNKMNNFYEPLLEKYIITCLENSKLIKLRDKLLPDLLNGNVDINNVEI